ncbi:MAG TPA: hypothetical protein VGW78_02615 [Candidatus Babeliales bacterium]|nr:hypothetical protein [Candidatus Babeliales bacterium]
MKKFFYIFLMLFIASSLNNSIRCSDYWQNAKTYWQGLKNYWSNPIYYQRSKVLSPYEIYKSPAELEKAKEKLAYYENLIAERGPQKEITQLTYYKSPPKTRANYVLKDIRTGEYISPEQIWEFNEQSPYLEYQKEAEKLKNRIQKLEQNQRSILDLLLTPQNPID